MFKNQEKILKYFFYILIIILVYALQTSSYFSLVPRQITINLLPFFLASLSLLEPPSDAVWLAVLIGILADAAALSSDGLLIIYYLLSGLIISFISKKYFTKVLPICLLLGSAVTLIQRFLAYVFYTRAAYGISALTAAQSTLSEIFVSAACFIPVFIIIKRIKYKFTQNEQE